MFHKQFDCFLPGANALMIDAITIADILGAHKGKRP